jgi:hypothetical protein
MIRMVDPVSPVADSVESALVTVPNPVPTFGDVRIVRSYLLSSVRQRDPRPAAAPAGRPGCR